MVERTLISRAVIDGVEAPLSGERWISDTKLRGFGLRVWRSTDGSTKCAFAIRITDEKGRSRRQTIPHWHCARVHERREPALYWRNQLYRPSLGELVQIARELARDRIDVLRGRPTLEHERKAQIQRVQRRVGNYKLRKAAEIIIRNLRASGRSKSYCDRLDKLFFTHVPKAVQDRALLRVTIKDVSAVLSKRTLSPANMRVLRPLLRRCFELADSVDARAMTRPHQVSDLVLDKSDRPSPRAINSWSSKKVEAARQHLRSLDSFWQQAACFELYLELGIPISILRRAKVTELYEVTNRWEQSEWKSVELHLGDHRKHRARLDDPMVELLFECDGRRAAQFPDSSYFFPSPVSAVDAHITSCAHVWSSLQREFRLENLSPLRFRRLWFEATWPERSRKIARWRLDVRGTGL